MTTPRLERDYSPVRHLAWALWLNHDPARCYMLQYASNYDAGGSKDSEAPLVVAGLVGNERRWRRFEREWEGLLGEYQIPYLHMKEFNSSKPPFESFKGNQQKRDRFCYHATQIIQRGVNKVIGHGVMPSDYWAVNERYRLDDFWGNCYTMAAVGCTMLVDGWMSTTHPGQAYEHIVSKGDSGQGFMRHTASRAGRMDVNFRERKNPITGRYWRPFEACDFVAWEFAREWGEQRKEQAGLDRAREMRFSMHMLARHIPQTFQVISADGIEKLAVELNVPPR